MTHVDSEFQLIELVNLECGCTVRMRKEVLAELQAFHGPEAVEELMQIAKDQHPDHTGAVLTFPDPDNPR